MTNPTPIKCLYCGDRKTLSGRVRLPNGAPSTPRPCPHCADS